MSKEAFYFSHDYNARNDPRLMRVLMKHGTNGIGIYWCIVEMLYEQGGYIPLINIESIAFELHTECERITSVLQDFDLFKFKDELFYSESVLRRLQVRDERSEGARQSALKRWHPDVYKKKDAKAVRTHSEGNAIKERKEKERIEKKNIEEDLGFIDNIYLNVFTDWLNYKKSRNEKYKNQKSLQACYRNLLRLANNNPEQARLIVDQAMGNNYAGLFPLKNSNNQPAQNPKMSTKYIPNGQV